MELKVNFNSNHWKKVYGVKHPFNDKTKRFDSYKQYCFPLKVYLGKNGKLESHRLIGKKLITFDEFEKSNKPSIYNIEEVCVHFFDGGFYYVLLAEQNKSHTIVIWENINSESELILNNISETRKKYHIL